mgnify:FL=1
MGQDNAVITAFKKLGETPLECLERARKENKIDAKIPMTYAGRLDPMAEGVLILLVGEECKNKEKYLGLDKEYEVEVLFGIETDTQDVLGLIKRIDIGNVKNVGSIENEKRNEKEGDVGKIDFKKYVGKFVQEYPMYSSKTIKGKQLHEYARAGEEIEEMPTKEVLIYSIEKINERKITGIEVVENILERIFLVTGDFRQIEIGEEWYAFGEEFGSIPFNIITLRVKCSSGTYMRTLADKIGKDVGVGALAYSIKRLKVGDYV